MTRRIFEISELTRLIASQLVLVSKGSTVNLARSSRYLEEPALSTLWETQSSLCILLEVLPKGTWIWENPVYDTSEVRGANPPSEQPKAQV